MRNKIYIKFIQALPISFLLVLTGCSNSHILGVLNPKGIITFQERQLLFDSLALMLIVVLPVIIMSFAFVYHYHQSHKVRDYRPNWNHNVFLEAIWWGVPCAIIIVLGIMTWHMSHKLDPYQKINFPGKIMQIKVVALPWKWLFIYPEQNLAVVNELEIPKNQQIEFLLTTDNVPMSGFFIPQIASQIYTMAGMQTRLHIVATHSGIFEGLNSQYNGDGFSDMHFKVHVVDQKTLTAWFKKVKQSPKALDNKNYSHLRQPKINAPIQYYSKVTPGLFKRIIQSYKSPEHP